VDESEGPVTDRLEPPERLLTPEEGMQPAPAAPARGAQLLGESLPTEVGVADVGSAGTLRTLARRFRRQRLAMASLVYIVLLIVLAIAAPLLAPADPDATALTDTLAPPSGDHLLGTDELGRDLLSRLLYGARVTLLAAAQGTSVALVLGCVLGVLAGYRGGWVDAVTMRITDGVMSIPPLILAVCIIGVMGPGLTNAMVAIGVIFAPRIIRLTRATVMGIRSSTFLEASVSIGTPPLRIIRKHVIVNALPPIIVAGSITIGLAMLAESSLSFLGLGVQPPQASWGSTLGRAIGYTDQAISLVIFPGLLITMTTLAFMLIGDGLQESIGRENRARGAGRP
jgi:peptide/nickel transport system permease protein